MKVLLLNGSPRANGNTATALAEMEKVFAQEGIEFETIQLGNWPIRGCTACRYCHKEGKCVFDDGVNELAAKLQESDGLVLASPVYYASANSTLTAAMDRLFYSSRFDKAMKVGASVAVARRGGCSSTFDALNKYFTIAQMPVVSSKYWNMVHGNTPEQVKQDLEGMQVMRYLGRNMAWMLKCIELGKQNGIVHPQPEEVRHSTNFIR